MNATTRIEQALLACDALHQQAIDLGLDRICALLAKLGNPHLHLPPVIHVAGSNGKGSCIAFVAAMAQAQGLRVHVHTSPHLLCLNERFVLAGQPIADAQLADLLEEVLQINQGAPATQFELLIAAMFLVFSRTPADIVIIETGLGGELDATNVVPDPALSIITPITLEHTDWLGSKISGIAAAKAGIIKPNCPVISAAQMDVARDILQITAEKNRASIQFMAEDFSALHEDARLVWQDERQLLDLPLPTLPGAHQIENAALAIAAAVHFGWPQSAIATGLTKVHWPGRLQKIIPIPPLSPDTEMWLDGAHNPHAAKALAAFLRQQNQQRPAELHLVVAMQSTKDVAGFLAHFEALQPNIHLVPLQHAPALAAKTEQYGSGASVHASVQQAFQAISEQPVRLVVTGSLYLVGEVLGMR
ncbi:Dihydrofolate synthase @ Folylpolyglutamate synthase [hydrothermal vent metagenome]|uniref:tetrahydrofolate synthase n=1 Tax=hydrothermal vent metagenome TaxID=652676 RepID=A0A3B0SA37_9ZZZZ